MCRRMTAVIAFLVVFCSPFLAYSKEGIKECTKAGKLSEEAAAAAVSNLSQAEKKLQDAIILCPSSASLHFNLGIVLFKQGRQDDAAAALEDAVRLAPDNPKMLNALAFLYVTRKGGDRLKAKELAERAVELDPRSRQYRDTLEMIIGKVDTPAKTAMSRPDGIAVVIGNRNYRSASLPTVKYAANDAAVMKRYLIETFGYEENNIITLNDSTFTDFVKVFGDAGDHRGVLYNRTRANAADVFIYYTGHGAPDTNTNKAYLVPVDADPSVVKLTAYSLDTLYENIGKLGREKNPRSVTIVVDSCFSGGSNDGMIIQNASPIFVETASPVMKMKNTVVFSSAQGNQISSWYPEKNHGLFTYLFLKNVKSSAESGKKLTAEALEKALLAPDGVNDLAWKLHNRKQEPQVTGDRSIVLVQ